MSNEEQVVQMAVKTDGTLSGTTWINSEEGRHILAKIDKLLGRIGELGGEVDQKRKQEFLDNLFSDMSKVKPSKGEYKYTPVLQEVHQQMSAINFDPGDSKAQMEAFSKAQGILQAASFKLPQHLTSWSTTKSLHLSNLYNYVSAYSKERFNEFVIDLHRAMQRAVETGESQFVDHDGEMFFKVESTGYIALCIPWKTFKFVEEKKTATEA